MDVKYKDYLANIKGKVVAKQQELDLDLSLLSDAAEFANGRVKFQYKRTEKQCKNSFVVVYGRDLESTTKRIELTTDYEFETQDNKYTSIAGKNTLIISPIPVKLVLNGVTRKGHLDYELIAGYAKSQVSSKLNVDISKKSKGDWNIKFNAGVNSHNVEFVSSRDIDESAQKSLVKHELKSSFGTNFALNSNFDNNPSTQKIDFTADGVVVIARGQKPLKLDFKLVLNPKQGHSNGKLIPDTTEFFIQLNTIQLKELENPNLLQHSKDSIAKLKLIPNTQLKQTNSIGVMISITISKRIKHVILHSIQRTNTQAHHSIVSMTLKLMVRNSTLKSMD